jgi:hypothetical protein
VPHDEIANGRLSSAQSKAPRAPTSSRSKLPDTPRDQRIARGRSHCNGARQPNPSPDAEVTIADHLHRNAHVAEAAPQGLAAGSSVDPQICFKQ